MNHAGRTRKQKYTDKFDQRDHCETKSHSKYICIGQNEMGYWIERNDQNEASYLLNSKRF